MKTLKEMETELNSLIYKKTKASRLIEEHSEQILFLDKEIRMLRKKIRDFGEQQRENQIRLFRLELRNLFLQFQGSADYFQTRAHGTISHNDFFTICNIETPIGRCEVEMIPEIRKLMRKFDIDKVYFHTLENSEYGNYYPVNVYIGDNADVLFL